jgi:hypothetical protein
MLVSIMATADPLLLVVSVLVFIILWAVIFKAVWKNLFRHKAVAALVSVCVTLLSMIGMYRELFDGRGQSTPDAGRGTGIDFLLILYAALGLAILFLLLQRLVSRKTGAKIKALPREILKGASEYQYDPGKKKHLRPEEGSRGRDADHRNTVHASDNRRRQPLPDGRGPVD